MLPVEPEDSEDTVRWQDKSDEDIASRVREEQRWKNFKFSRKHIANIKDICKLVADSVVQKSLTRFGERLGELEERVTEMRHAMEIKDLGQDGAIEKIEQRLEDKITSAIWIVSVIGALLTLALAALALVK